jgi:hypothetical protein
MENGDCFVPRKDGAQRAVIAGWRAVHRHCDCEERSRKQSPKRETRSKPTLGVASRCVGLKASLRACCKAGALLLQRRSEDATPSEGNPKQSLRGLAIASCLAMTVHGTLSCKDGHTPFIVHRSSFIVHRTSLTDILLLLCFFKSEKDPLYEEKPLSLGQF